MVKEAPGRPAASHGSGPTLQDMSGNPLLRVTRDGDKRFKVVETE